MAHAIVPIRYDDDKERDFQSTLKDRVAAYLRTRPNGRYADGFMWFKVWLFITAFWGVWASLAFVRHSLPVTAVLLASLACLAVSQAYTVSHDAVHDALSRTPWVNKALFYFTFNAFGPSASLWRERHVVMHHTCVNIPGWDFNIEIGPMFRFSPTHRWRPYHRFQHLYAPLLYMFFTLEWIFVKDFRLLRTTSLGNVTNIRHPWWRPFEVVAWKLFYVTIMLVIPTLATGYAFWQVLVAFVCFQFFGSFQFVLTFAGSHLNEGMLFVEATDDHKVPHSFFEHALRTSLDFDPTHPVVSFFLGGFNAHVAHHMFPHVCSVHYPELTRIIRTTAAEFGLPYYEMSTVRLYVAHFRYLKALGRDDASTREAYLLPAGRAIPAAPAS